jgi:hypothetical protein
MSMLHLLLALAAASPGDLAFAAGRFDDALAAYTAAAAADPTDVDARLGLGTIELYRNQLADARRDLGIALQRDPDNARAKSRLATIALREGSPDTFLTDMHGAPEIDVPLLGIDPLPTVAVTVNGHPLTLFIDTGATTIDLSPEAAAAVGAQVTSGGQGVFAGGKTAGFGTTSLAQVQIAGLSVSALPAHVIPGLAADELKTEFGGLRVDGALGGVFLSHFLSTIDYANHKLILRPASDSAAFEAAAEQRHADLRPMWLVGDHFIFTRARINAAPEALFNIDTGGAGIGVQLTKAEIDAARVRPDMAHAQNFLGGGGAAKAVPFSASVTLGSRTIRDVPGLYFTEGDQYGIFPFTCAGTISHEFFRTTALTFDFVAMRMLVE